MLCAGVAFRKLTHVRKGVMPMTYENPTPGLALARRSRIG